MGGSQLRGAAVVPLVAALLAGCGGGGGDKAAAAQPGKTVSGETETGMTMKVETFVPADSDPMLKKLDAYRGGAGYPAVDFHRVTVDNSKGEVPDRIRDITFATDADAIMTGKGSPTRFACDALRYEWPPVADKAPQERFDELMKTICAIPPDAPEGVEPGQRTVYYLVSDRSFGERGIRSMKVFGPRSAEFK
ncbi:MAG TPA: hypothetical protein VNS09_03555 [Solirubrobacter sp.]|nr:hypothetical protein [Solirubrobacter sp.]